MEPRLRENFPGLFPRPPTINNLESAPSESIIPGDHGRSIVDCESSSDAIICDDEYLVSLIRKIKSIEFKLEEWDAKCQKPRPANRLYNTRTNPSIFLREALTELVEVTSHVQRLRDSPVLFGDSRIREHFFITATSIFQAMAQFVDNAKMLQGVVANAETEKRKTLSSSPVRAEDNEKIPPWLSFCAPSKQHQSKEIQHIHEKFGGRLQLQSVQILPAQGALIQEHWRQQVNGFARNIATTSDDPSRTLGMRVEPKTYHKDYAKIVRPEEKQDWEEDDEKDDEIDDGYCQLTKRTMTPFHVEKNRQEFAFGEQDPVKIGRSARLIAKLLGESTTTGGPYAIAMSKSTRKKD
ncbi:hypothetical protein PRZ48_013649 [Zasmidium cellare]|uniref:Uncharacterized protein n=1 Tax=Zasmidium cellare TaxID=395010 RepID=A0ABR0E1N2_ZASCE|nr:hypothetical protein PRZ48_013649 [Zasmidium cellare]